MKKLSPRMKHYLSFGGRLTLVNRSASKDTYISHVPCAHYGDIEKRINRLRSNFLWESNSKRRKFHRVKWKDVIQGKMGGGTGIKNLILHNKGWWNRYKKS